MTRLSEKQYQSLILRHSNLLAPPFKLPANEAGRLALGRLPAGKMNKTEAAYAERLALLASPQNGYIRWWKFEGIKLRLADATFYTPDFSVLTSDNVFELHEVKGFWEDDARVKIKVAAALFPFRFIAVTRHKGGSWDMEEFG